MQSIRERKCLALIINYLLQQTADTQSLVYCDNGRDLRRKPHGGDEIGEGAILTLNVASYQ
ncbi:hypothetical protein E5845_06000 [Pseudomonas fluorescens]|nr:hypothetical protein E5845_06000 [Pseudomonas fluorescens]